MTDVQNIAASPSANETENNINESQAFPPSPCVPSQPDEASKNQYQIDSGDKSGSDGKPIGTSRTTCPNSTSNKIQKEEFKFLAPPDCPVFRPTAEEFKNPLQYISKLRPFAENYGICKIQPPKTWTPPFTVDVENLRFTPRVQRLNELEAQTRVKLNFLDQIAKFWELQGSALKIPIIERKTLDLYTLHHLVQDEGSIEQVTHDRKWSQVASRLGYPSGKGIETILKGHYERILHPFDIFKSGKVVDLKLETNPEDREYKPHRIVSRQQISPPCDTSIGGRIKRYTLKNKTIRSALTATAKPVKFVAPSGICTEEVMPVDNIPKGAADHSFRVSDCNPPLARSARMDRSTASGYGSGSTSVDNRRAKKVDPLAKYICHICERGDVEESMLLCDGCDDSCHTFCLIPPLSDVPKEVWRCPKCVNEEVKKFSEAFGFEQAQREYTLQKFGDMADRFKANYFNMPVHLVPAELIEREFWRLMSSIDEDVTVEYGADIRTMDHGSGFPTKSSVFLLPGDQEYAESSWNLNNLPLLEESVLGYINADISGMKVPWMYVGMCFSTVCWHNEDHWSCSINYLHWGEPKTWYGVPGSQADAFEKAMKSAAPELFQSQPDLLHQLVTALNPNVLMNAGVPVFRTDQQAGEFVVTFPRAYHAGFNQGYNFAEAVNFAPADWIKIGRECINHYSKLCRYCVFSHDELVCKMALDPDRLSMGIASACYIDMAEMVDCEKKLRKSVLDWGVLHVEREAFELLPDDERQCDTCKTTCFLSAVACSCTKSIACLRHYKELCTCTPEKLTLKFRYTLDELPMMLKKLKTKVQNYEKWLTRVRDALDSNRSTRIAIEEMRELVKVAENQNFPSTLILDHLNSALVDAEKCVTLIQQLEINKMRTRNRNVSHINMLKLNLAELEMLLLEIDNLSCVLQEGKWLRELHNTGKKFVIASEKVLDRPLHELSASKIEHLIEDGQSLCIDLPYTQLLRDRQQHVQWYSRVRRFRDPPGEKIPICELKLLIKDGLQLTPNKFLEKELSDLQEIQLSAEDFEEVAQKCFQQGTQHELPEVEMLLKRGDLIEADLPSQSILNDALKRAREWLAIVETLRVQEYHPYLHTLESIVKRGDKIPFALEELQRMSSHLEEARIWKDQTERAFFRKRTRFRLLEVLSPRCAAVLLGAGQTPSTNIDGLLEEHFTEEMDPRAFVNAFKLAEDKELIDMKLLRRQNMLKNPERDVYCVCNCKFEGIMYNCRLCRNWFHADCVRLQGTNRSHRKSNKAIFHNVPQLSGCERDRNPKYLCNSCMRSRRPRLEIVLSLLASLERIPIRMPEGDALLCLSERAMDWQDRARKALAVENVASALVALSIRSQRNGSELGKHSGSASSSLSNSNVRDDKNYVDDDAEITSSSDEEFRLPKLASITIFPKLIDADISSENTSATIVSGNQVEGGPPSSPATTEHAYSVSPMTSTAYFPNIPTASQYAMLKSSASAISQPIKSNFGDPVLINLPVAAKEHLEGLLMEGDLLEVSFAETAHLWRILNAVKPGLPDLVYMRERSKIEPRSEKLYRLGKKARSAKGIMDAALLKDDPSKRILKVLTNTASDPVEQRSITILPSLTSGNRNGRRSEISLDESASGSKKRKRRSAATIQKKQEKKKAKAAALLIDDGEECSATHCARPSDREINWVQCDGGCNMWFHMFCVGLSKYQINANDDFVCTQCKKSQENKSVYKKKKNVVVHGPSPSREIQ